MEDNELLPGEALVLALDKLRERLIKSGTQRTAGLFDSMGTDCKYYWKSLAVFLKRDYEELREMVNQVNMMFKECEENSEEPRGNFTLTGEDNDGQQT